jgi:hypothetical protein
VDGARWFARRVRSRRLAASYFEEALKRAPDNSSAQRRGRLGEV